jgi:hypothetical protein
MKGKFLIITLSLCLFMTVAASQAAPPKPETMVFHEVFVDEEGGMLVKVINHGTLAFKEMIPDTLYCVELDLLQTMRAYVNEDGEYGNFIGLMKANFHYVGTIVEEPSFDGDWLEKLGILDTGVLMVDRVQALAGTGKVEKIHWVVLWEAGVPNPVVEIGLPFNFPP